MRTATLYRYSLPMEAGIGLRNRPLKTREGLILHVQQDEREGWGEIAPLPYFSTETLAQAQEETQAWLSAWLAGETPAEPQWPSVDFGTSCALAELDGSLPQAGDYRTVPLCSGDPDDLFAALNAMPGEKIAKVKVGLYESVRDGMIVNMLLEALPDLKLRLDANRAWTRAKAEGFAKYVNPDYRPRIQFLEEPCKTPQESLDYAQYTGINIAWDETVRDEGFEVQAQDGVSAIVIKPTLVGSLQRCQMLVEQAHAAGLIAVISSSIESSLGLTQLARVAAWLTPDTMPGLDTLSMMQAQVLRPWPDSALPLWSVSQLEKVWPC